LGCLAGDQNAITGSGKVDTGRLRPPQAASRQPIADESADPARGDLLQTVVSSLRMQFDPVRIIMLAAIRKRLTTTRMMTMWAGAGSVAA